MATQAEQAGYLTLPLLDREKWAHPIGDQPQLIGRGGECDLRLFDPSVSRAHALIWAESNGGFYVSDMSSSNGVHINGKRLRDKRAPLVPGDVLRLGPNTAFCLQTRGGKSLSSAIGKKTGLRAARLFADIMRGKPSDALTSDDVHGLSWRFQSLLHESSFRMVWKEVAAWLQGWTSAMRVAFVICADPQAAWKVCECVSRTDLTACGVIPAEIIQCCLDEPCPQINATSQDDHGAREWSVAVPVRCGAETMAICAMWDRESRGDLRNWQCLTEVCAELVTRLAEVQHQKRRVADSKPTPGAALADPRGHSSRYAANRALIDRIAPTDINILIFGETGVGKEVLAREIHTQSGRRGPFVACHCGAIPEPLVEDHLFGHVRGAFTGADREHRGYFERAHGGTLFLDEIGEATLTTQVKLLRAIQDKRIQPVGGENFKEVDLRVIAASNRDLRKMVQDGDFREDLYFRIAEEFIRVPPLRERTEEIRRLIADFLARETITEDGPLELTNAAYRKLMSYEWPGNIRELKSVLRRAVVRSEMVKIDAPQIVFLPVGKRTSDSAQQAATCDEHRRRHVLSALAAARGNKTEAATTLGIDRGTLRRWLQKWNHEVQA